MALTNWWSIFIDQLPEVKIEARGAEQIRYTLNGTIPDLNSPLYSKPFQLSHSSVVSARSFSGEDQESYTSTAYYRLVNSSSGNGVKYHYYEGGGWKFLPVFESLKPLKTDTKYQFRIDNVNERDDQFGIQFHAYLKIDQEGEYRFYTTSDDGSKLYINEKEVVNNDGDHGAIERLGSMHLSQGFYSIRVDYFNQAGGYWLDVYYKGPGIPKQIIPADKLYLELH